MNKPAPEDLKSFFSSEIFQTESVRKGDYTEVIEVFYKMFCSDPDQTRLNEIGIHMDQISREQLIFDEQTELDFKITIDFHFIKEPENKQSFSLIGKEEEKAFFNQNKEELLSFFILQFRRFSSLLIQ